MCVSLCQRVCTCGSKSVFTQTSLPDVMNIPYLCLSPNSHSPPHPLKHSLLGQNTASQLKNRYSTSEHTVGIDRLFFSFVKMGDVINRSEVVSAFPRWRHAYARFISAALQRGGSGLWMKGKRRFMLMTACC